MSIFIANLAFDDPGLLAAAKFAVLVASVLAATLGLLLGPSAGRVCDSEGSSVKVSLCGPRLIEPQP